MLPRNQHCLAGKLGDVQCDNNSHEQAPSVPAPAAVGSEVLALRRSFSPPAAVGSAVLGAALCAPTSAEVRVDHASGKPHNTQAAEHGAALPPVDAAAALPAQSECHLSTNVF